MLKHRISLWIFLLTLMGTLSGCVHDVPSTVAPAGAICQQIPQANRKQARIGIYLDDDMRKYVYKKKIMGVTFRMNIGRMLSPILMQMVPAMKLDDVVFVNSLPPYGNSCTPDVDAVIEPEILYCSGTLKGTVTGHIDVKITMRMTVYDAAGKVLWQDKAVGVSRSEDLNIAGNYLGILEMADRTGHEAIFSAVGRFIDDFNDGLPRELYTHDEVENPHTLMNKGASDFEFFKRYYRNARVQYGKRNFYRALCLFKKANILNPGDLSTLFYMSACYTYTGEKDKALRTFKKFFELSQTSQEAGDSKKWIELLKEPLKIGFVGSPGSGHTNKDDTLIQRALTDSGMYEIVEMPRVKRPAKGKATPEFTRFLDKCHDRGVKIVLFDDVNYTARKAVEDGQRGADTAMEYIASISVKAYSTKKKELRNEIRIDERASTIRGKNKNEESAIRRQLFEKGGTELVLRLLENEIF